MTVKAIFVDLDGTLVDTREANYRAYSMALAETGREFTQADFARTWGRDSREFLAELWPDLPESESRAIRSRKSELYPDNLPGLAVNKPLLTWLGQARNDLAVALVTTAKKSSVHQVLATIGAQNLFDFVVFGEDVENAKPAPDAYLVALARAGVTATEAIAIEDSDHGVAAAIAAAIPVIRIAPFV